MKAVVYQSSPARWALCKAASFFRRGAAFGRLSGLRLVERPVPELPGEHWVRLRTILGGVCGTDLALVALRNHPATILQRFAAFPATLGHENVASIDSVGPAVRDWRVGERVCVEPAMGCAARSAEPPCAACAEGRTSLCEHFGDERLPPRALIGLNRLTGGSWAEFFVAHESQLHRVPAEVSDDAAVLVDPIASAAHAVLRRPPRDGEHVLVNGGGIIALGVVAAIRAMRRANPVSMTARHTFQADLARRLGAIDIIPSRRGEGSRERYDEIARRVGGRRVPGRFGNQGMIGGFDLVYDCTGTGRGLGDAMKWTKSRGTLVAVGTSGIAVLDTTPMWFDEIEVIGANGQQVETHEGRRVHTYDLVFEWAASGRLDLSAFPVTRFPLSQFRIALDQLLDRRRHPLLKAAFDPRG